MRKWVITGIMAVMAAGLATGARAEGVLSALNENLSGKGLEVTASADVAVYDKYIWRGFRLDGDHVVQPGFTVGIGPIEGGFWGSWDMQNNDGLSSDESDGWIGISQDLGFMSEDLAFVSLSAGHTWYAFPEADTYSKEWYIGFSLDTLLSPSFTWYHDYEKEEQGGAHGDYYILTLGHSFTLAERFGITLDLGEELGYNEKAFMAGKGGWSTTSVGLTVPLTDNLTMSPKIAFTSPWDDLASGSDGNQNDELWGGVAFSFSM